MSKKLLPLLAIFLIGLLFRTYHYSELFQFGHEQDLQAWIVKDVLVDKHFRLIGQETSITGVFIGPLYYYTLAFFFALGNLNPLASVIPVTIISLATLLSVYYVFTKLFSKEVGYVGSFIYAISLPIAFLDRWAVPTQPTLLWCIWFLYVITNFTRGKFSSMPILIVLLGIIWHIHVAFIPLLVLVPIAFLISKRPFPQVIKEITTKKTLVAIVIAILLLIPFVVFESRHGFQQTKSIFTATKEGDTVLTGLFKEEVIIENVDRVLTGFLWEDASLNFYSISIIPTTLIAFFFLIFFLMKQKQISKKEMFLIFSWIISVILIHSISKRPLSEYYFNNLIIISLLVVSLLFGYLSKLKGLKYLVIGLGVFFLFNNLYALVIRRPLVNEYVDRANAVRFIAEDARKNNYPCIGITYIGEIGVEYGYRYFFWWNKVNQISPGDRVPVYNLAIPSSIAPNEVTQTFGTIGVILPKNFSVDPSVCDDPTRQLQSLNGFVN